MIIKGKLPSVKIKSAKKSMHSSTYKKNLDTMKLLVSDPEFKDLLKEIREHLEITENGFSKDADTEKWADKMYTKSDEILESKKFLQQESAIKDRLNRKEIGIRMAKKQSGLLYEQVPWNYLNNMSLFLADKFNIPRHFQEHIKRYIVAGYISAPTNNFKGGYFPAWKKSSEANYLPIEIYSKLSNDELRELKKYIDFAAPHLPDYNFKPLEDINRDLKIEDWYQNRERWDQVEEKNYKLSTREIAGELLGNPSKTKEVYEIVKDLKRKRNRRFKKMGD